MAIISDRTGSGIRPVKNEVQIQDARVSCNVGIINEHEFLVVGTHVDKRILPGFHYRVRFSRTPHFLFGGKPMLLESVGRGYGKRLTFASSDKNDNNNYFYSDSSLDGYAFSPIAVKIGDQLDILSISGPKSEKSGRLQIVNVTREQEELEMRLGEDGKSIEKVFRVYFTAKVLSATDKLLSCKVRSWTSVDCNGICVITKKRGKKVAEIDHIELKVGSCLAGFKLVLPNPKVQHK